jgi:hypothetical protein
VFARYLPYAVFDALFLDRHNADLPRHTGHIASETIQVRYWPAMGSYEDSIDHYFFDVRITALRAHLMARRNPNLPLVLPKSLTSRSEAPVAESRCLNCTAPLNARFCANCGQAGGNHMPNAMQFVHQTVETLTHADSRLWRTIRLLWFRPGQLTLEFIGGRCASFLPPVRLYFVCSVIFFTLFSLSRPRTALMRFIHAKHRPQLSPASCSNWHVFGDHAWTRHLTHICEESVRDHGVNLLHAAVDTIPDAMFVFVPLIAFSHMFMYSRPRHPYAEHLLFFLHVHAFFFSIMTVWMIFPTSGAIWHASWSTPVWLTIPMLSVLPVYGAVALKRVFRRSWVGTVARTLALLSIYIAASGVMMVGVLIYALLRA